MIGCQQGSALEGSRCAKFTHPQMKKEKQPESLLMEKFDVRELIRKF